MRARQAAGLPGAAMLQGHPWLRRCAAVLLAGLGLAAHLEARAAPRVASAAVDEEPGSPAAETLADAAQTIRKEATLPDASAPERVPRHLAGRIVTRVDVLGLERTEPSIVRRELLVVEAAPLDLAAVDESVQRLRNLQIFHSVHADAVEEGAGARVTLRLREKWTTLPIMAGGRGGDRLFLSVGAHDLNFLGRMLWVGGYYYHFAGTHSGVAWFEDPRLGGRRQSLRIEAELGHRNRYLYDDAGELQGAYSRHRRRVRASWTDLHHARRTWGGGLEWNADHFSTRLLDDTERTANATNHAQLPGRRQNLIARGQFTLGRLDQDDFLVAGRLLAASLEVSRQEWGSDDDFVRAVVSGHAGLRLGSRQNLVGRVIAGSMSADTPEQVFYLGGLAYNRGFFEGQFRGKHMWNANLEYRVPSLDNDFAALQHVFFVDAGDAGDDPETLVSFARAPPVSVGTGLRGIVPWIARCLVRLDVAAGFAARTDWRVSFGSQQFF